MDIEIRSDFSQSSHPTPSRSSALLNQTGKQITVIPHIFRFYNDWSRGNVVDEPELEPTVRGALDAGSCDADAICLQIIDIGNKINTACAALEDLSIMIKSRVVRMTNR